MNNEDNSAVLSSLECQNGSKSLCSADQIDPDRSNENGKNYDGIFDSCQSEAIEEAADQDVLNASSRIMKRNRYVYKELAK